VHLVAYLISRGNGNWTDKCTFKNFAPHATDATRRDKAWDRAGKLRLVMRIRTILVAVLISPFFYQKVDRSGTRSWRISTLCVSSPFTRASPMQIALCVCVCIYYAALVHSI